MWVTKICITLAVLLFANTASSEDRVDPYVQLVSAHRLASAAHQSVVDMSERWEEPMRADLLTAFSEGNLKLIAVEVLQQHFSESEAASTAQFLSSPHGRKLVAQGFGEDVEISDAEWDIILQFMRTKSGKHYSSFSEEGMVEYHRIIRSKAESIVDRRR